MKEREKLDEVVKRVREIQKIQRRLARIEQEAEAEAEEIERARED